jgi:hypothetical protein
MGTCLPLRTLSPLLVQPKSAKSDGRFAIKPAISGQKSTQRENGACLGSDHNRPVFILLKRLVIVDYLERTEAVCQPLLAWASPRPSRNDKSILSYLTSVFPLEGPTLQ